MAKIAGLKVRKVADLPGQGDQISLQPHRFGGQFQALIDLMEIAAHTQEEPARTDRGQIIIAQAAVRVDQVLNAIRLGEKPAAVEGVKVNLSRGGLVTANEVPRQPNAGHRKPQPPREQNIHQAQVDGIASPLVYHAVQVTVFRVVIVLLVAREAKVVKEIVVDDAEDILRLDLGSQTAPEFVRVTVQHSLVGLDIDQRILCLREQPCRQFEVEFLAVTEAKRKEMVVRRLAVEVQNDLARAPAQRWVVAHGERPQPLGGRGTAGKKLLADRPVNHWIIIAQQTEQGDALALRELLRRCGSANRIHRLTLHISKTQKARQIKKEMRVGGELTQDKCCRDGELDEDEDRH